MEVSYRKNLSKSYMCMEEQDAMAEPYELQIMDSCKIPGLLQMQAIMKDHSHRYLYDISGKQQIGDYLSGQKLGYGLLQRFLFSLQKMCSSLWDYLLREEGICLELECIYVNLEDGTILFTYLPFYSKNLPQAFRECMEQLLRKMDHQDHHAVALGYQVYQACIQDNISIASILEHGLGKGADPKEQGEEEDHFCQSPKQNNGKETDHPQAAGVRLVSSCQKKEEGDIRSSWKLPDLIQFIDKYLPEFIRNIYGGPEKFLNATKKKQEKTSRLHTKKEKKHKRISNSEKKSLFTNKREYSKKEGFFAQGTFSKEGEAFRKESQERQTEISFEQEEITAPPTEILAPLETSPLGRLVYQGNSNCEDIQVEGEAFILGKNAAQVDGFINGKGVSRLHARITCREGQYFLEDLNSTNGTYLNDTVLVYHQPRAVDRNDRIRFGMEEFLFL